MDYNRNSVPKFFSIEDYEYENSDSSEEDDYEGSISSKSLILPKASILSRGSIKFPITSKFSVSSRVSKFSKALKASASIKSHHSTIDDDTKQPKQPRTLLQKIGLMIESFIYIFLLFLIIYILSNILLNSYEKNELKYYEYGEKLIINYHSMYVGIAGEQNEPTIVLLPDLGISSPIIYYKPLVEALSDKYKVITMEPLGYGLSDIVEEERTIENIVSELHLAIKDLGIEKYYLMGHSVGGLYSLYWSNQYQQEVLGFIGFDMIVPNSEEIVNEKVKKFKNTAIKNQFGIERILSFFSSKILSQPLPSSYNYSDEENKMFRIITLQNGFNETKKKEVDEIIKNMNTIKAMKFPKNVPVLNFICSENINQYPNWKMLHIEVGKESISNEVLVIRGDNTNSIFDHRATLSKFIKSWTN